MFWIRWIDVTKRSNTLKKKREKEALGCQKVRSRSFIILRIINGSWFRV